MTPLILKMSVSLDGYVAPADGSSDWEAAGRIHGKFFSLIRPASPMVVVAALLNPGWRIEIVEPTDDGQPSAGPGRLRLVLERAAV